MAKIIKPQNREEWLSLRGMGIGSSEIGTLFGTNPFETPLQLWMRKKGMIPQQPETYAMARGHIFEDAVAQTYARETGREIIKASAGDWIMQDEERPYMRVSPDRTFWLPNAVRNNSNKGIVECKTTNMQVDEDNVPAHWIFQLVYQLGVAGYEFGSIAWVTGNFDFGYKDIVMQGKAVEMYQAIVEKVDEWWSRYIVGNERPQPINVQDVLLIAPKSVLAKTVTADETLQAAWEELGNIKANMKSEEARRDELESLIKMAIGDAEGMVSTDGKVLATWKSGKDTTRFNQTAFKEDEPELYAKYCETKAGARTFLLKK